MMNLIVHSQNNINIGLIKKEDKAALYEAEWFSKKYDRYSPKIGKLEAVKAKVLNSKIDIVLGTWCHDSKTWVPRFLRLFDMLDIPKNNITIYNIDRKKRKPRKVVKHFKIKYVPTVIFYKGNTELGRIIEYPDETIEDDILKIFQTQSNQ